MTAELVALDLAGGPGFVEALQRVWDDGDAAFPVDQRVPAPARAALVATMAPSRIVDTSGSSRLDGGRATEDGDALVVATSGSTGEPRGAVLTHAAVRASAMATNDRLAVTDDDHWLACLPLSHVGGLSVVTRALAAGTRLTVLPGFDSDLVMTSGATLVSLVATALSRIQPSVFRTIVLGGAAPPPELPPNVVVTYGMTETGSGVVYDGVPLSDVEICVADDGEIHLRGPMLLRAYRDGTVPLIDGWFATGDAGRWLADGRLYVEGRRGDVIITGGENVWPAPVEAVLARHPKVAAVAVVGTDDPEWGQAVTAYVVPAGDPPSLDELRTTVREALPPWCAPRRLVLTEELPRTALGKVARHRLSPPS